MQSSAPSCTTPGQGHGYIEIAAPGYMLTITDRGTDTLASLGTVGEETATALKAEARRRAEAGCFFGSIAYVSLVADKPA